MRCVSIQTNNKVKFDMYLITKTREIKGNITYFVSMDDYFNISIIIILVKLNIFS